MQHAISAPVLTTLNMVPGGARVPADHLPGWADQAALSRPSTPSVASDMVESTLQELLSSVQVPVRQASPLGRVAAYEQVAAAVQRLQAAAAESAGPQQASHVPPAAQPPLQPHAAAQFLHDGAPQPQPQPLLLTPPLADGMRPASGPWGGSSAAAAPTLDQRPEWQPHGGAAFAGQHPGQPQHRARDGSRASSEAHLVQGPSSQALMTSTGAGPGSSQQQSHQAPASGNVPALLHQCLCVFIQCMERAVMPVPVRLHRMLAAHVVSSSWLQEDAVEWRHLLQACQT